MSPAFRVRSLTTPPPPVVAEVYVKDPLVERQEGVGRIKLKLPGEPWLGPGPTSARFEVRDEVEAVDGFERFADPVMPYARGGGFAIGRSKEHQQWQPHQVNVWAHAQRALGLVEDPRVLGRRVTWAFGEGRLVLRPHAFEEDNAYYDRDQGAIHFGHFEAREGSDARRVYTCLSHDVIVHELGHAVLDGLKPLYYELDSPEVAGFHEYFGDALAMVSSLTMREVVKDAVRDRSAQLSLRNLVSDIALELGSAGHGHVPLRTASNKRTMRDLADNLSEHDHSEVLSGAFYDLLRALYADTVPRRARELGKSLRDGQVVVGALISAAERTSRMLLRALDYCPPCGLTYAEYVRAVLRSDEVAYPVDERGYRRLATDVFARRGVVRGRHQRATARLDNAQLREYDVDQLAASPTDAYGFLDANREALQLPRDVNFEVLQLYRTRKVSSGRFYPPREVVVEYAWPHTVRLRGASRAVIDSDEATLWCGGTLVFDMNGNVLHHTASGATRVRVSRFRAYLERLAQVGHLANAYEVRAVNGRPRVTKKARLRHGFGRPVP